MTAKNLEFVVNLARYEDDIFNKPSGFQGFGQISYLA
jgi:hypothetical protein